LPHTAEPSKTSSHRRRTGIHWPDVDEDISVAGRLRVSQRSNPALRSEIPVDLQRRLAKVCADMNVRISRAPVISIQSHYVPNNHMITHPHPDVIQMGVHHHNSVSALKFESPRGRLFWHARFIGGVIDPNFSDHSIKRSMERSISTTRIGPSTAACPGEETAAVTTIANWTLRRRVGPNIRKCSHCPPGGQTVSTASVAASPAARLQSAACSTHPRPSATRDEAA
jgi:hypothetical protein